jgi:hypothetical protein
MDLRSVLGSVFKMLPIVPEILSHCVKLGKMSLQLRLREKENIEHKIQKIGLGGEKF